MSMEHKSRLLLIILLCVCLNPFVLGQSSNLSERASHPVPLVKAPTIDSHYSGNSLASMLAYAEQEPIALLLCGLMLFVGATTLRRKRSSNREQTSENIETSL